MYRHLLSKRFIRENPVMEYSVQRIVYSMFLYDGLEEIARDITFEHGELGAERLKTISDEKKMILAASDPEAVFKLLRKETDPLNRQMLIEKALEYESDILPMVTEKLIRNNHDVFIENAIRLLAKSKVDYSGTLKKRFDEIRSPYVKSLVCLILGMRGDEEIIPWMMQQFFALEELNDLYPDSTFDQGPLLALYELRERFY